MQTLTKALITQIVFNQLEQMDLLTSHKMAKINQIMDEINQIIKLATFERYGYESYSRQNIQSY